MDLQQRLDHLEGLGLQRRMRMVSGPQGPRIVLDGEPVLVLCSSNYLGLADHPRVREAAADAAMRWGVGAGAARAASGTMTVHRRLETRLAAFMRTPAALLFGSGYLAAVGVVPALAEAGGLIFADELNHAALADGCALAAAETRLYRHGDVEHLAALMAQAAGRPMLVVTDSVFATDGDVAPLEDLAALAERHRARLVVDEGHGIGCLGPGGRGAVAEAGLEGAVDVVIGSLGKALGSYGAFAACDGVTARYLAQRARTLLGSTAPPPPAVAGALAALELLAEQPQRVAKLQANADALRAELAREGFETAGSTTQIVAVVVGDAALAARICDAAIERGVLAEALRPPEVPHGTSRLRLTAMASHTKAELREGAQVLGRAALQTGFRPGAGLPVAATHALPARPGVFDAEARAA
ncbi:aminotransferase class I/II-fold pyridoxal phosphate-dependent enzyme [Capillimicrobium parvum]|uniref:8-amino-7-oxononanoate synthase n=1 Tax=Capillimicrobium parvum TaxID=2884022 RepID=A0A9E6Y158_9ACTN|nr:8-amino-7-oxononanoate synthase [Capillimicrobium parvum]UGS38164.1 8-amino-7-oxononanoate synthase [Capillimicrobium parvum]